MLSRSCLQELELISTSAELHAAQCHFITFLMHILAKINKYVGIKKYIILLSFRRKNPNEKTTKPKSRAVIPHFVNSSKISQTFLMFSCPDDVKESLLKRGSSVAVFLKNIPLLNAVLFDCCFGGFL